MLEVFHTKVIIKATKEPKETAGGIVIPEGNKVKMERPGKGTVIAVGISVNKKREERGDPPLAEGDHVIFPKYDLADTDGEDNEALGILEEEKIAGRIT